MSFTSPLAKLNDLLEEAREFRPALRPLLLFSAVIALLSITPMIFTLQIFERVMPSRNAYTLIALCLIALFLMIVWNAIEKIRVELLRKVAFALDDKISVRVLETLSRFPETVPIQQSNLVLQDLANLRDFIGGYLMVQILDFIFVPIIILVAFMLHPILGLTVLVLTILSAALSLLSQRAVREDAIRQVQAATRANEFGRMINTNSESIRVMGMLPRLIARWRGLQVESLGWGHGAMVRAQVFTWSLRLLRHLYMPALQAVAVVLYLGEMVGAGVVVAAGILVMRAIQPVDALANGWQTIWNVKLSADRLDALLKKEREKTKRIALPRPDGPLVVSRISVRPRGRDIPTLQDVSFMAMPGSVVGVVGPSGAGKSTLARALTGAWPLLRGSIQLDDHDIAHWDPDLLGTHIGYVPQDIELIPGTLAENIARFEAVTSGNSQRLIDAVKGAGILDIVSKLPDGLNTRVGPDGAVLSGGQRQRVALARALYGDPRLVVMDEPNSNIDAAGEQLLANAINRLKNAGAIVILITHRMNMLVYCDQVLVLNSGTVHAFGGRDEILDRIGGYRPKQIADNRTGSRANGAPAM